MQTALLVVFRLALFGLKGGIVFSSSDGVMGGQRLEQLRGLYDFRLPTSTIFTITARVSEDVLAWQNRPRIRYT